MRWGALVYGVAGEVVFGEQRFVRAGLIGVRFCWVWHVSAGAVRLGISCCVTIWCGRRGFVCHLRIGTFSFGKLR